MPVVITGDMTAEEVDEAMIEDLRQQVASGNPDGTTTLNISYAQAQRILELLDQGGGSSRSTKAAPQARAAAVDEDDDDDKPKSKTRR